MCIGRAVSISLHPFRLMSFDCIAPTLQQPRRGTDYHRPLNYFARSGLICDSPLPRDAALEEQAKRERNGWCLVTFPTGHENTSCSIRASFSADAYEQLKPRRDVGYLPLPWISNFLKTIPAGKWLQEPATRQAWYDYAHPITFPLCNHLDFSDFEVGDAVLKTIRTPMVVLQGEFCGEICNAYNSVWYCTECQALINFQAWDHNIWVLRINIDIRLGNGLGDATDSYNWYRHVSPKGHTVREWGEKWLGLEAEYHNTP